MYMPTANNAQVATPPRLVKTQHNLQRMVSSPQSRRAVNVTLATRVSDGLVATSGSQSINAPLPRHERVANATSTDACTSGDERSRVVNRVACNLLNAAGCAPSTAAMRIQVPQSPQVVSRVPQLSTLQSLQGVSLSSVSSLTSSASLTPGISLPSTTSLNAGMALPSTSNLNPGMALPSTSNLTVGMALSSSANLNPGMALPSSTNLTVGMVLPSPVNVNAGIALPSTTSLGSGMTLPSPAHLQGIALQVPLASPNSVAPQQLNKAMRDKGAPIIVPKTISSLSSPGYVPPTLALSPVGSSAGSMLRPAQVSPHIRQRSNPQVSTCIGINGNDANNGLASGKDDAGGINGHTGVSHPITAGMLSSGAKPVLLQPRANAARSISPFPTHVSNATAMTQFKISPSTVKSEAKSSLEFATQVVISNHVVQVGDILGKGSFGSVWAAKCEKYGEVAIKEIMGETTASYEKATSEVQLINRIHREVCASNTELRMPKCLYWDTQKRFENERWRIRMAMTRIPGMSLSSWMLKYLGDHALNFHKATVMALTLLKQFAPTMHAIERCVYHRDVNSHNILVAEDAGAFNFYLIDFGLAVDSGMWRGYDASRRGDFRYNLSTASNYQSPADSRRFARPTNENWKTLDIGGDCKYWPTASWKQFMWGWKSLSEDDVYHYRHRLDFHSLGITCYELIFYQATSIPYEDDITPELRQLIDDLREVWAHYWTQSTHYWTQLFGTFTGKKDWKALRDLMRHSVTNAFQSNLKRLRQATSSLLKARFPPQWAHLKPLFTVLHDLIDTRGALSWKDVEEIITDGAKNYLAMRASHYVQRPHRRARSIDTDATFSGRVADREDHLDSVPAHESPSMSPTRTHLRAKSDPAPPDTL